MTASSPSASKKTVTPTAAQRVTPNHKTIPTKPDVKAAAGMNGLINRSPVVTKPSSLCRWPRHMAVPARKHRLQPEQVTVAAESVPGLISWVSAAAGASSPSRLSEAVAARISPSQAIKIPISSPVQKVSVSKPGNLITQKSPKTGGPSPAQRSNNDGPDVRAVAKRKWMPSTLFSNPKLHKLLRNPASRETAKASGVLMYKQRPMRL
ncbi:hypothetical protein BJ741DRAFT_632457 [Chytriomyces cf. hyalinus JEL632]|nr:hypothetical protein BJ741DRAFT_632457 [Chytriomyces cf. hyalinus JEL632]